MTPDDEEVPAEADGAFVADTPEATGTEDADAERAADGRVARPSASEAIEMAQRVQAEYENYRKRVMRDQTELVERANDALVEKLLPVLDSFELALTNLEGAEERVRKGVELVYAELLSVLERAGLERIETAGAEFDPGVHEAVTHEEGDGHPVVIDTLRSGYRLKNRVLRPAMVRVGSAR